MSKIRAGLIGISGYTGMELARLLVNHPHMSLSMACSRNEAGRRLGEFYPFLRDLAGADLRIGVFDADKAADACDVVFLAVPAGTAMNMAAELLARDVKVVDFSADFRLADAEVYQRWYGKPHTQKSLLGEAVYGLPELYAENIKKARLIANPGCYPTACIFGLYFALKNHIVKPDSLIIDAKSGASGAGRKAVTANLFCEVSDDFRAYGVAGHRHTPEIEQELQKITGSYHAVNFTPHLVPMKRGILATIYGDLADGGMTTEKVHELYQDRWRDQPWIRVLPPGQWPQTVNVRGSMFCDMAVVVDQRTKRLIILSVIDNLCRGASGQALANANLMCGLPVDCGLKNLAPLL